MIIQMLTIGDTETNLGRMLSNDSENILIDLSILDGEYEYGYTTYDYRYNTLYTIKDLLGVTFTTTDLLKDHDTVKLLDRYKVLPTDDNGVVEDYKKYLKDDVFEYLSKSLDADLDTYDNRSIHFTEFLLLSYIAKRDLKQKIDIEVYILEEDDDYSHDYGDMTITYNSNTNHCKVTVKHHMYLDDTRITTEVPIDVTEGLIRELMGIEDERDRNKRFLKYLNDYLVDKKISLCVD